MFSEEAVFSLGGGGETRRWTRPRDASRCRHSLTEKVCQQLTQIKGYASSPGLGPAPPRSQVQGSTLTPYPSPSPHFLPALMLVRQDRLASALAFAQSLAIVALPIQVI